MKSFKNILLLFLIWIISLLALSFSFLFYSGETLTVQKVIGGTFIMIIYSGIFSFPAFAFFFLVSFFSLRSTRLSIMQKKMIMTGANLTDILLTFGALFLLVDGNHLDHASAKGLLNMRDIFSFYPLWILVIVSSILIFVFPFNFNKSK